MQTRKVINMGKLFFCDPARMGEGGHNLPKAIIFKMSQYQLIASLVAPTASRNFCTFPIVDLTEEIC